MRVDGVGGNPSVPMGVDIQTDVQTGATQVQFLADALKQAVRVSQTSFSYAGAGRGRKVDTVA